MEKLCIKETQGIDVCPFCGGSTKLHKDVWKTGENEYARSFWIRCKKCGSCSAEYSNEDGAVAAWNRRHQQWISVADRLPEESGMYIVTAKDGKVHRVSFVLWQKRNRAWNLTGARSYWRITHWMPMPQPAKGEPNDKC